MRLRKDDTSWKAQGLKAKLKVVPEVFTAKRKKNTKRWCKGVVGREHDYELKIPTNESNAIAGFRKIPTCNNCGRQDYHGVVYRQDDGSYSKEWNINA